MKSLTLLLFSFVAAPPAVAEIFESIETKNYFISPRSASEIKPELMRHSPIREHGGSFNGRTDWYIKWDYKSSQQPYGCQLHGATVNIRVIYTLPALSDYVTDLQTIKTFDKFNTALTRHEHNHGKNGLTAAREIEKAFTEIKINKPQQNCRNLARMIDGIGNSIIKNYAQADRDYDRLTNNGLTEGAVIY